MENNLSCLPLKKFNFINLILNCSLQGDWAEPVLIRVVLLIKGERGKKQECPLWIKNEEGKRKEKVEVLTISHTVHFYLSSSS